MKCILGSLLTLPCRSAASSPMRRSSKNAKVPLVYQHKLPNVPGKSIKGVLVNTARGPACYI